MIVDVFQGAIAGAVGGVTASIMLSLCGQYRQHQDDRRFILNDLRREMDQAGTTIASYNLVKVGYSDVTDPGSPDLEPEEVSDRRRMLSEHRKLGLYPDMLVGGGIDSEGGLSWSVSHLQWHKMDGLVERALFVPTSEEGQVRMTREGWYWTRRCWKDRVHETLCLLAMTRSGREYYREKLKRLWKKALELQE